jgi:hypothetical protein
MLEISEKLKKFEQFLDGPRMLMLTHRTKEGGISNNPDKVSKRVITRNTEEFIKEFNALEIIKNNSLDPLRIYSSLNKRDTNKAIREFKFRMLEADYYDEESKQSFYFDVKNRWLSCLMDPKSRTETKFLIDIDDNSLVDKVCQFLTGARINIIYQYPTKNGTHVITEPFNPNIIKNIYPEIGISKDGLILLSF